MWREWLAQGLLDRQRDSHAREKTAGEDGSLPGQRCHKNIAPTLCLDDSVAVRQAQAVPSPVALCVKGSNLLQFIRPAHPVTVIGTFDRDISRAHVTDPFQRFAQTPRFFDRISPLRHGIRGLDTGSQAPAQAGACRTDGPVLHGAWVRVRVFISPPDDCNRLRHDSGTSVRRRRFQKLEVQGFVGARPPKLGPPNLRGACWRFLWICTQSQTRVGLS